MNGENLLEGLTGDGGVAQEGGSTKHICPYSGVCGFNGHSPSAREKFCRGGDYSECENYGIFVGAGKAEVHEI